MCSRRMASAALLAAMLTSLLAWPVGAREPIPRPASTLAERPLTAAERAASDRKVAAALGYVAAQRASGAHLLPLSCFTPSGSVAAGTADSACYVPQRYLGVQARDQIRSHYCGPAVGQVISNYTWDTGAQNKYTQTQIAGWMQTDVRGQTSAPELEDGLEAGDRRRPTTAGRLGLGDHRRPGSQTRTGPPEMSCTRSCRPTSPRADAARDPGQATRRGLPVQPRQLAQPGLLGRALDRRVRLVRTLERQRFARTYYTDSSKDEGGPTGYFLFATRHLAGLIREHTGRFVW